jgi:hypothetical protein
MEYDVCQQDLVLIKKSHCATLFVCAAGKPITMSTTGHGLCKQCSLTTHYKVASSLGKHPCILVQSRGPLLLQIATGLNIHLTYRTTGALRHSQPPKREHMERSRYPQCIIRTI